MPAEPLVDANFLAKLLSGSYEVAMGAVEEAVQANAHDLFGDASAEVIATFSDHFIAATPSGEFYRGRWSLDEEDAIEISEVDAIEVPVFESTAMGSEIRREANEAVESLLRGSTEEATEQLRGLYNLVKSGATLTAEGVEDTYLSQEWSEADWYQAIRENDESIRAFLGADVDRIRIPKTKFESVISGEMDESEEENHRPAVLSALRQLREFIDSLGERLDLAVEVQPGYSLRGGSETEEEGGAMAAGEFAEFVEDFVEDLQGASGILDDALAVADDGCIPCLARVHDGLAEQMYEWAVAALFAEKLARRFDAHQAA